MIDFAETRIRNVASDFARLEPLVMLQWTRIAGAADAENVLRAIDRSLAGSIWARPPAPTGSADPMLGRAVTLVGDLRSLAAARVGDPSHETAYLLPLLQWSMPVVAFQQVEPERKRLAAWASARILEKILETMDLPGDSAG